jgi:hypothetical protein
MQLSNSSGSGVEERFPGGDVFMKSILHRHVLQSADSIADDGANATATLDEEQDGHGEDVIVICPICEAQFAPEPDHADLNDVELDALNAAFQSVCHVCFRCHRSACPQCWDDVHHVCCACVQEAGLTFRAEAKPLAGLLFPPKIQATTSSPERSSSASPFVCVQPGRLQAQAQQQSATDRLTRGSSAVVPMSEGETQEQDQELEQVEDVEEVAVVEDALPVGWLVGALRTIEQIVTIVLCLTLLAVGAAIVLAELSQPANAWIARLLHVDIRAEIAYLIIWIRQIHW